MMNQTDEYWRGKLTDKQYRTMRLGATEPPFTGKYVSHKGKGMYVCAGCGAKLFSSETKFDSQSGWPSFWEAVDPKAVLLREDTSMGMVRTEVTCASCGGHLGHVFDDGPADKTGKRYCLNSCALNFKKD